LLVSNLFDSEEGFFDPSFGKTGGEDGDFFRRMMRNGKTFVWSEEAWVYEIVPLERLKRSYFLKRALLQGLAFAKSEKYTICSLDTFKSLAALVLYAIALPVLLLLRYDLFVRYLIKECYHFSKLLARCGVRIVKERAF
jgi:hypothetical protein